MPPPQPSPLNLQASLAGDACQNRKTLDQLCNLCGPTMLPPPPQYSIVTENMRCQNLHQSDICMADTIRKNIAPKYHYRDTFNWTTTPISSKEF